MPSSNARALAATTHPEPLPRFTIGRSKGGGWVVQDREGRVGGLFISESAALHFASDECDHDATQIAITRTRTLLPFGRPDGGEHVH
ncbi:hypothetical protein [Rhizobium sp. AN80A]|uniref:hypothetical protein n=1 Tax=Rhizobium sp. AN80A TaxID=3040673 RepID=UPI0024B373F8|nr:hypothetical protein [Rhizobium sp. AN80A]